ncbi:uncharacterized protein [Medicago truncatula]|uniref:uncharacterized protein n=1 Tax=Medicago truncatula TaxID=3880 RepID=UPI001967E506|nr:uncharacterized protein LOC112420898 [Medicago truncatula]XP_039689634.1 uncharacterized protein LOC112420898 [Medicago truncatula]XP_039689635.1 uncharacterized protein LOC112420898 [Medicago truncatula]
MYRDSFGVIGSVINSNIQTPMGNQPVFSLNDNTPPLRPISLFNRIPYDINTNGKTPLPTPNIFYPETLPNYTQPTSSTNFQMPKRTPKLLNQQGVNLMNRFSEVDTDKASSSGVNDQIPNPIGSSDDDTSSIDTEEQAAFMSHHESESNSSEDEDEVMSINNNTQLPNLEAGYSDIGDPSFECRKCGACMWYQERRRKSRESSNPEFGMCCGNGKIQIPFLPTPPPLLNDLMFNNYSTESKQFNQNIRLYNSMFAFSSPGFKVDKGVIPGRGPPTIRIQGQSCHRMGSMIPAAGKTPKFAQLYIFDTDNELQNRVQGIRNPNLNMQTVSKLQQMLDDTNCHAKSFRKARDRLRQGNVENLKLKLISDRTTDGRIYNQPTVSEVAALIVGDVDSAARRDIIMERQSGRLERIDEFHPAYLAYQYPLLFPYGEDGYRDDVLHRGIVAGKQSKMDRLTIREWLTFRLQSRKTEAMTILCARRLFQQFLVDCFTMMEADRLKWLRKNQSKLRVGKYRSLSNNQGNVDGQTKKQGKRVVLPSSYVGGRRYMDQLYFDGMAISSDVGFPDLFITFTCNPSWPEIQRFVGAKGLKPHDRPDIIARVFKIKFDELLNDLTKKHILGKVVAYMYTIEFQKRGLPHAHILIFLHPSSKYPTPDHINQIISAEIPHPENDRELYKLVGTHMMHGPCGLAKPSSPCMKKKR